MADAPKAAAEKAEAPVETPSARPPLFSMVGWVVLVGVCLIEFAVVSLVGKMSSKEGESDKDAKIEVEYLELDPFNVTFMDPNGVHTLTTKIALGMDPKRYGKGVKPEDQDKVTHRMPKIRHEINIVIQSQKWPDVTFLEGQERLRVKILEKMQEKEMFPPDWVREVCIESFEPH